MWQGWYIEGGSKNFILCGNFFFYYESRCLRGGLHYMYISHTLPPYLSR